MFCLSSGVDAAEGATRRSEAGRFVCYFTEPFDTFVVLTNAAIHDDADGQPEWFDRFRRRVTANGIEITGDYATSSVRMVIRRGEGSDGMSDFISDWVGSITGRPDGGRCHRFSTGTAAAIVSGVARDDELNIRARPSASAPILTTAAPGSYVFVKTSSVTGRWIGVEGLEYPTGGHGSVMVVSGWANRRFLTELIPGRPIKAI